MPGIKIDTIDRRILQALQADGRLSNVDLADRVGLSPSPCLRRVKRLEDAGVIAGYRAVIDPARVSLGIRAYVDVSIDQGKDPGGTGFREAVRDMPEITACRIVSGERDFLLEALVPDLEAYTALVLNPLLALDGVTNVSTNFVLETVKDTPAVSLDHL